MNERIVITDGHTLNPGDLDWSPLERFGEVVIYPRTAEELVAERCREATVIVTNKTPVRREVIESARRLRLVAVTATGFNIVDADAARALRIPVCNVPGYGTDSVAQHTFALVLELANHTGQNGASVAEGGWQRSPDFCYSVRPIVELSGKVMGIVGYGRIGQKVAEIAKAFGMRVLYHSPSRQGTDPASLPIGEIFAASDIVSLHCPLTADNAKFVNRALLATMKPTALLINTARGQLVHEDDLAAALREKKIAGAGLDVLSQEPPPAGHPLTGLENCLITPHNAWLSFEARTRIMKTTQENIAAALSGKPVNVVNPF